MTRANSDPLQSAPWFAKAGAACSIVPISRFVTPEIFALKGGGYGCFFELTGLDEESLTDQELDSHIRTIEGALRGLPEGACLYQYVRIRSGFPLPKRDSYSHVMTDVIVGERVRFLDAQANFRRMDLHWCLTVEPAQPNVFTRTPRENAAATSRMLAELQKAAILLAGNLGNALGLRLLPKTSTYQFLSYLFNLEDWAELDWLRADDGVDRQIVKNPVHWESDHLRIGRRFVQMYSLQATPEASRPCLFADISKLDCDSILCTTWRPKSTADARGEIDKQEKFIEFFKVGVLTRLMSGRDFASLDRGAGAKAATTQVDDLGEVIRSLDKKAQGEFSLRLLIAARTRQDLQGLSPAVHRIFVEARAAVMEETLGNLSGFYAMFPGNGKTTTLSAIRQGAEQSGYVVEGFAPTSRAAHQLREADVSAGTLQGFLARATRASDPSAKHLYMVDESSLASTEQVRDFLRKIGPEDKVLLIGDIRQHQGVDAGKPFEQLQASGMQTALLDRIVRQRDPDLLKAVEHLSRNETTVGVQMLQAQGRVTEIPDAEQRIAAIAKAYIAQPENTIIVSPDNASRRAINQAVRQQMQLSGTLAMVEQTILVLTPLSDMTGADREWAARYATGDILHYVRGSKDTGIEAGEYAKVVETDPKANLITVQRSDGKLVTYDPSRLRGISAYREIEREFSVGDRVQLTAPNRDLQVANRDLGTLKSFDKDGRLTLRMDNGKDVSFDPNEMRHFDHGYAVTSHSSQGLTSQRVLVNMDSDVHPELINARFAYVSVSRASHDAQVFTNDAANLAENLSKDVSKTSALAISGGRRDVPSIGQSQVQIAPLKSGGLGLGL